MSVQAMTWALEQRLVADASARHVLLCLANYADKDGRNAFPSAASLAEDTGLSERTVRYKLDSLESAGLIARGNQAIALAHIERRDRTPVCYDLMMRRGANPAPRDEVVTGCNGCTSEDATGCNPQQNGVQSTTERGAAVAPNPSLNRQLTEKPLRGVGELQRSPMVEGWQPDEGQLVAQCRMQGVDRELITEATVQEFVAFWLTRAVADSAGGWCHRLVKRARAVVRQAPPAPAAPRGDWAAGGVIL